MSQTQALQPPPTLASPLWTPRYDMLDAWRGLAALAVVGCHAFGWDFGSKGVMIFFVISGYCVTAAAESARKKSLGFRGFMWRRVKRIYPPYFFALAFFMITRYIKLRQGGADQFHHPALQWLQNLTLTQWFSMIAHPLPQPTFNGVNWVIAFWSLQYEEQFYLLLALALPLTLLWRWRGLGLLMLISLLWKFILPSTYFGFFIELFFHFGIGAVVYYRLCVLTAPRIRMTIDSALLAGSILFTAAWLTIDSTPPSPGAPIPPYSAASLDLAVVCLFGLLLTWLRPLDNIMKFPPLRPLMWLGAISYSLYLTHQFNLNVAKSAADKIAHIESHALPHILLELLTFIAIAALFWFFCERPFLNKPLARSTAPKPTDI